jgi:uncharacterized alpha-E superfamily protein
VREQISSEMWEKLSRLFRCVMSTSISEIWNVGPNEFFRVVDEGSHLFQGIADSPMNHGEGWQFIQLGRFRQIDEIMQSSLHEFVNDNQRQCAQIYTVIQQTYIAYPVR